MLECHPAMVPLSKAFWARLCVVLGTAVTFFIITLCIYVQRPIECLRINSTDSSRELPPPPFQKPPVRSLKELKALNGVVNPYGPDLLRWGASPVDDPQAQIGALFLALRSFQKGGIAYHVSPKMRQGKEEKVQVRITKDVNEKMLTLIKHNLRSTVNASELKVDPYMIVQLHDASNGNTFQIVPLVADKQSLVGNGYSTWAWSVMPLEAGQQKLYLSVGTRFRLPMNSEETEFEPLYVRSINVQMDRIYQTKRFLSTNWQPLIVALLVPLVVLLWQHRKRKLQRTDGILRLPLVVKGSFNKPLKPLKDMASCLNKQGRHFCVRGSQLALTRSATPAFKHTIDVIANCVSGIHAAKSLH
jgi:hypothetical protein